MNAAPDCIIGAGLAGLIAAQAWPQIPILEASPEPQQRHNALLRFRSDAVARLTGIEFRKVRVRKGIYTDSHGFTAPSIRLANMYSQKVLNGQLVPERSIWSVEPVDRWIAPENLYWQLVDVCAARIQWRCPADFVGLAQRKQRVINTAPLPVVLKELLYARADVTLEAARAALRFDSSAICVDRYRIPGADVHQTIYFPDGHLNVYRASITGDMLIVESIGQARESCMAAVRNAFALDDAGLLELLPAPSQRYGKIAPVDDAMRKALLRHLTTAYGVYSLGRFATWRNILLDDIVDDIAVLKRLLRADGAYDVARLESKDA